MSADNKSPTPIPHAYFITFRTYGTWLHGDERGSVDRLHNEPGTPLIKPDAERELAAIERRKQEVVMLSPDERRVVEEAIRGVCQHREWKLVALNARTNHVHVVVHAAREPEFVMTSLKAWSTRRLVESGTRAAGKKIWSRHGSTRYLWNEESVRDAARYTMDGQENGGHMHGDR